MSDEDLVHVDVLMAHTRVVYDQLVGVPIDDLVRRRDLWSEIVRIHDQITAILSQSGNP